MIPNYIVYDMYVYNEIWYIHYYSDFSSHSKCLQGAKKNEANFPKFNI